MSARRPAGAAAAAARRLLLSLALIAAAAAAQAGSECEQNPTLEACKTYTLPDDQLEAELYQLCAGSTLGSQAYTGWPSGCALWHECREGRADASVCQPMVLLQTACVSTMTTPDPVCLKHMVRCAPQSLIAQCSTQPPIRSLRPAPQLMSAVQRLCNGTASASPAVTAPAEDGRAGVAGVASTAAAADDRVGVAATVGTAGAEDGLGRVGVAAAALPTTDVALTGADSSAEADAELEATCSTCSAMSPSPDKVMVQATEANCPDPLATLSTLCLARADADTAEGCAPWRQFCESEAGAGFPSLCGGDPANITALVPGTGGAAAAAATTIGGGATQVPAASWTDPARAAATALQRDDCYSKPQQDKCRTFLQEDSASEEDIERLCGSLPSMPACTLRQQCSSGAAGGAYCQPFSLLGSLCAPSPAMGGCQRWAALCATSGSVVQQCVTAAPIRNAPVTAQTLDVVTSACATAEGALLPACQQCEAAGWNTMDADCPQPLELMGELCRGNPTLPQCASFRALCTEAGATFGSLCGGGGPSSGSGETPRAGATAVPPGSDGSGSGSSSDPALDKTWLHASMTARILFYSWVPTGGAYVASCLAVMALAAALQALRALRAHCEARWAAQAAAGPCSSSSSATSSCAAPSRSSCEGPGDHRRSSAMSSMPMLRTSINASCAYGRSSMFDATGAPLPLAAPAPAPSGFMTRAELARNAGRAALAGGLLCLELAVMLVAVTFNLGLLISLVLGAALGALAFGHIQERARLAAAGGSAWAQAPVGAMVGLPASPAAAGVDLETQYGAQ